MMSKVQLVARTPMVVREEGLPSEPLVPFVRYVVVAEDAYLTDAELFPAARKNADHLTTQFEADRDDPFWRAEGPHVHALFAASRNVLGVLYDIAGERPLVAMPTTSLLLVGKDWADPSHLLGAAIDAYDRADEQDRLSCALYVLERDVLRPYWLPEAHHLAEDLRKAHRRLAFDVYNEQKDHFEDSFDELEPIEVAFWASVLDVSGEDESKNWTASVWSQGLETLLPETELLLLKPESGTPIVVRWEDAFAVLGEDAPPVFDVVEPVRYRAKGWPSPAQIAALEARRITL